ncbi:hypothetical protein HAX54_036588 [Datura stramonium]|uniref:YABBY N-terminal domain-containing protein n=1 Tax=Datura stramonium TaxID=4076 RepID=A0ABS8SGC0_DATST|nr:hypothetical protein [Datura stramonium]
MSRRRCGHCANLLSVNIAPSLHQSLPLQDLQRQDQSSIEDGSRSYGSSSSSTTHVTDFLPFLLIMINLDHLLFAHQRKDNVIFLPTTDLSRGDPKDKGKQLLILATEKLLALPKWHISYPLWTQAGWQQANQ